MKKFKFLSIFLVVCTLLSLAILPTAYALEDPAVNANAVVLLEMNTGETFYSKNADIRAFPASTTKVMTVLLAVEACENGTVSLEDQVTASENFTYDLIPDGSSANIQLGETLSLEQLMYLALVASANDACNVIAEYVGGTISGFVDMMNKRAGELGCTGTHFNNTHGLPDENHYTTAWDLSLIVREAVSHAAFAQIFGTQYYQVPATNLSDVRSISNTNALLGDNGYYNGYTYEYATGGKTGHTSAAGYCLVSTAAKDNISLLAVVLGGQAVDNGDGTMTFGHFKDSITLYDWALTNFSYQEILRSTELIADIPVEMGSDAESVTVRPQNSITALVPNDVMTDSFTREVVIFSERDKEKLQAPISAGDVLGEITVSKDGVIYGKTSLVAAKGVDLSKLYYMKAQIKEALESDTVKNTVRVLVVLFVLYLIWVIWYRIRRMRHNQSVRRAKKERARRMAELEAKRYEAQFYDEQPSAARRTTAAPTSQPEPEMDFFTDETYEDESYYDYEEAPMSTPEQPQTDAERDYFEEFFRRK